MTKEYNEYLVRHINSVKECYKLLTGEELESHDNSKLTPAELQQYDNYFYPKENGITKDKKVEDEFDYAWLHHQNCNKHHWQYWVLVGDDDGKNKPLEIPDRYIHEMIADWGSFAYQKKNGQELLDWYQDHLHKIQLAPETKKKVDTLVKVMVRKIDENFK